MTAAGASGAGIEDHNPLLNDLTEERVELADGHVVAPTRPGLGLTLRRDFVREITVPV